MELNIAVCLGCGEVLRSLSVHDFKQCKCPNQSFTDGGLEYVRRGGMRMELVQDCSSDLQARIVSDAIKIRNERGIGPRHGGAPEAGGEGRGPIEGSANRPVAEHYPEKSEQQSADGPLFKGRGSRHKPSAKARKG